MPEKNSRTCRRRCDCQYLHPHHDGGATTGNQQNIVLILLPMCYQSAKISHYSTRFCKSAQRKNPENIRFSGFFPLSLQKFLQFRHECIHILELPINRSEPDIGNWVQQSQLVHRYLTYLTAGNLLFFSVE